MQGGFFLGRLSRRNFLYSQDMPSQSWWWICWTCIQFGDWSVRTFLQNAGWKVLTKIVQERRRLFSWLHRCNENVYQKLQRTLSLASTLSNLGRGLAWHIVDSPSVPTRRRLGTHIFAQPEGSFVRHPLPSWSWVGWYAEVRFEIFSGDRRWSAKGLQYYTIDMLNSLRHIKVLQISTSGSEEADRPWMGIERVARLENVPHILIGSPLTRVALVFWTSISQLWLQFRPAESKRGWIKHDGKGRGMANNTKFYFHWKHKPFGLSEEPPHLVVSFLETHSRKT